MAEIGTAVAGRVVDSLFDKAKKEIGYIWNCSENVENFKREAKKLEVRRGKVKELVDLAIGKGDKLSYGVEEWVKEADTEISNADKFLNEEANAKKTCCKIGVCGNWGTLHRYGKRATKMAPSLLELHDRGSTYENCVSVETPAPGPIDVYQNKHLDDLHTHKSALGHIIKSLEDDNIQITGIYGLGGVGKTTLAMEAVARVKNMFADVAFTTVSQNVDVEKIKKDIGAATKRIMKGDKILIILDDVWEKLNLEELCIPCGNNYMNCKILLTSRSQKVCHKMHAQSKVCVNALPIKEAWIIFKRIVGEKLETDSNLKPVALKVVEECGGLPLLIQAIGNALKDENIQSWNSALTQLQKHAPSSIDDEIQKAFTHLKLSYEYLKSEEAKSCFLLCSLFPEDHQITFEELVFYGVGLEKFDNLDSIEDARGRVQNAVNILTSSGLLLNVMSAGVTKMHDVVRDVALLIASQGNEKFLVKSGKGLTEWLPLKYNIESYKGIALRGTHINKLPDCEVNLPRLQLLVLIGNYDLSMISDEFIRGMKNVRVLDISWNNISSLPQSFQLLTKLRTLDLGGNKSLHEISILWVLRDLEILILNGTGITEIPKEFAQLVNLRVLQVKNCVELSRITQGVISSLSRLEELCIDLGRMSEGVNGCTAEIMMLSKLTYLDLKVKSFDLIPEGFDTKNLKGFILQIGDFIGRLGFNRANYLIISTSHLVIPLSKTLKNLIEVSPTNTVLCGIENINNILPTMYDEGFNKVGSIELWKCPNVSCLVDDSTKCDEDEGKREEKYFNRIKVLVLVQLNKLKVLWKCPHEYITLTNLVSVHIEGCGKLARVFTVSVAQGLVNLKLLAIVNCSSLKEVIWGGDDESGNIIVFPSLDIITLMNSRRLKSFYSGGNENCSIKYPSLVEVELKDCGSMELWGHGIHETPNLQSILDLSNDARQRLHLEGANAINDVIGKAHEIWTRDSKKQSDGEEKEDESEEEAEGDDREGDNNADEE
uniref:probable disease resistance protein At4g27220 n=1 Tax=Erigeron canadensis TaxID=72917 RepID=UPI001CB916C3|nr:probable disease resistance protein At4g27220 [Erigeron canadensis]